MMSYQPRPYCIEGGVEVSIIVLSMLLGASLDALSVSVLPDALLLV
jgi:hypothetical protein